MKKSYFCVAVAAFLFGTMEVALKLAGGTFNALQMTFIRFLIGGAALFPFAVRDLRKRQYRLTGGDWLYLLLLGIICICVSMTLFQSGVMRTSANLAAAIISMSPIFTMLFAHFVAGDRFTARKAVVLLLSCIGLAIISNPSRLARGAVSGMLLTLLAAVTFGLYSALGKRRVNRIGGVAQNSLSFLMGSAVLLVMLLVTRTPVADGISVDAMPLLLYLGVCVTGIGYLAYVKAIELAGPSAASITFFIKPVFAPFIAWLVLKEAITVNFVVGVSFMLAGSLVSLRGKSSRRISGG